VHVAFAGPRKSLRKVRDGHAAGQAVSTASALEVRLHFVAVGLRMMRVNDAATVTRKDWQRLGDLSRRKMHRFATDRRRAIVYKRVQFCGEWGHE